MKMILGLAAKARSGKDTAASILLAHPEVAAFALADPLKDGCRALFGLTATQAWDDTAKEKTLVAWGKSPREFFQMAGTEWMRAHDPLHWLKRADREINGAVALPLPLTPERASAPEAPFVQAAQSFFGLSDAQAWDEDLRDHLDGFWGMSPREMIDLVKQLALQEFPDFEARREEHLLSSTPDSADIKSPAKLDLNNKEVIIIKDIRFENEAEYIRNLNGQIWHILRDHSEQVKQHSSEAGINVAKDDIVIENNGTLEEYKLKLDTAWKELNRALKAAKAKDKTNNADYDVGTPPRG